MVRVVSALAPPGLFVLSAPKTAYAQDNCGRLFPNQIGICTNPECGQCTVMVNSCALGFSRVRTYVFPGVQCPCNINEYVGTAEKAGTCSQLARPSVRVAIDPVAAPPRSFFIYLPNCAADFSVEEVLA